MAGDALIREPGPARAAGAPILAVEDLRVALPVDGSLLPAVDGVGFALARGECIAVVGESGSGKSQLARAILGLPPEGGRVSGRVVFEGRDLLGRPDAEWRRVRGGGIGMVFQEPAAALDPVRTIGDQIGEALRLHAAVSRREARRRAASALGDVGYPDPEGGLDEYPHRLSGGLRQRAMLATALAPDPRVLIADEPTASLDATVAAQVLELFDRLRRERSLAILLISHDLGVVAHHSDRVLVLYAGRVVEEAPTARLFRSPAHPYTRGLLRSIPALERETGPRDLSRRYQAIAGNAPDLSQRPRGICAFTPRCPERFGRCEEAEPGPYPTPAGTARCFLYERGPGTAR